MNDIRLTVAWTKIHLWLWSGHLAKMKTDLQRKWRKCLVWCTKNHHFGFLPALKWNLSWFGLVGLGLSDVNIEIFLFPDSNRLILEILLFLCPCPAAACKGGDKTAHGEDDGEAGEGDVPPRAAFAEAEVEDGAFRFSWRDQEWKKEETEDM